MNQRCELFCRVSVAGGLLAAALFAMGCHRAPQRIQVPVVQMLNGQTMGTTYSVKLVPVAGMPPLSDISSQIQAELDVVNQQMSTYREDSELSRFNDSRSTDWFEVSADTARTVQLALEFSQRTAGAFDVTVGPLVDLWGFGPAGRALQTPSDAELKRVLSHCGHEKLEVRLEPPGLRKMNPQLRVDLSAIAKGHGVDRVARVLDGLGIDAYFVEIGGEIRTRGRKQDGQKWRVGIERPDTLQRDVASVLELENASLATSGDYRNFYELDSHRISHTIDPRTGKPVENEVASASVVADRCDRADAIATSMMVLGKEQGLGLAEEHDWAVLLLVREGTELKSFTSSSMKRILDAQTD